MESPETRRELDISRAISDGWSALCRSPLEAILGYLIFTQVAGCIALIPFVYFPLLGGLTVLFLNIAHRPKGNFEDLLAGFKDYWKWMGLVALMALGYIAAAIPAGAGILGAILAGVFVKDRADLEGLMIALIVTSLIVGILASTVIYIILSLRWFFVLFVGADGGGILESFEVSVRMARGNYLKLFLVNLLILVATGIAALVTCGMGVYFIGPVTMLIRARMYVDLKPPEREA